MKPQPGDIIYTREGTLGSAAAIPENTELCLGQRLMLMRPAKYVDFVFLTLLLQFTICIKNCSEIHSWQLRKAYQRGRCQKIPNPPPPLAEQHRIVAKVDALMALCDALELRLKERAGVQERLAGAVVKQVAG